MLDEAGERLMSLSSRLSSAPNDAYWALSTADAKFQTVKLSTGEDVTVSYGQYRAILATRREQSDRAAAFRALHETYQNSLNTYATLYNGVCQRDWFQARARGYKSTLDAALHGDNIPTSVVENLIETTRAGVGPLQRYHKLRRKTLGVPSYHVYDYLDPARHLREEVRVRPRARLDRGVGRAARAAVPGTHARGLRRRLDRRLRERRQALGRVLGAGLRDTPVHAAELHGHARRHVHARARDGALDAHHPVARGTAVRVLELHDLRRRGAVNAQRGAAARLPPRPVDRPRRARRPAAARDRQHRGHVLHAGALRRLRTARASPRGTRSADHGGDPDGDLPDAPRPSTTATRWTSTSRPGSRGRGSRTSSTRRTTCTSTPPASRQPLGSRSRSCTDRRRRDTTPAIGS